MDKLNIFLDSTALYIDPLFKNSFSQLLLDLQKDGRLNIFISKVVHNESLNNYEKQFREGYQTIKKEADRLNNLTFENQKPILKEISDLIKEYDHFYNVHIQNGNFTLVEYKESLLPELIQRSIQRIKPFTEARQEFRDAIIWLSYVGIIKSNGLRSNFFITNNKRDFWDDKNIELHPELRKEIKDLKVYANFQELLTKENSILKMIKEKDFSNWLSEQELSAENILEIIKVNLWTQLSDSIDQSINKLKPEQYFPDIKATYFEYKYQSDGLTMGQFSVEQISNFGYVECLIYLDALAIIYPIERFWSKEKRPIVFRINMTFTFDLNMKITDQSITSISINYDNSKT